MEEIKRVLFTKRRVLILLMLVLYCVFYFGKPLLSENAFDTRDGWASYLETYRDVELKKVNSSLNKITKNGEDYLALDLYGRLFQNQVNYLLDYPDFLENIQWQAGTMLNVSIFRTDDTSVLKTAADYKQMEGVELSIGMDQAVTHAMWRDTSDWLLAAYMLVIAFSFVAEKKRGLWNMVCASPKGRFSLPMCRLFCLIVAALFGAVIFTGIEAVSGWILYGGFNELGRIVQSIETFKGFTIPMTIGQFWLYYAALRFVGAFLVGMVFWLFFEIIPDRRLAAIAFALFAGLEYVLFKIFPGNYLLDTVNLFMWISPKNLLTSYEVLKVFGQALSRLDVYFAVGIIGAVIGITAILICYKVRKPTGGIGWVTRLADWWRKHTAFVGFHGRLFFHELYKMLITGRGAIVLIAALLISFSVAQSPFLGNDGGMVNQSLEAYYRQSQGELSQESYDYLEKQRTKLAELEEGYASLQIRYEKGYINDLEYRALSLQYQDLGEKQMALDQYEQDLAYWETIDNAHIVPHWVYAELFGVGSNTVGTLQVVALLASALLCVLYASTEGATGMTKARRATPGGRSKALAARYGAGFLFSTLISLLIWGLQLYLLHDSYGTLPLLQAPICCLRYFTDLPQSMTIIGYWGITVAIRTTIVSSLSVGLLWLTDRLQK